MRTLLLSMVMSFASFIAMAEEIVWHLQSHTTKENAYHELFNKYVIDPVNAELAGEFKLVYHEQKPKDSLASNKDLFSSVRYAEFHGMLAPSYYWGNVDPIFTIVGDLTAAWNTQEDFLEWYAKNDGQTHLSKIYGRHNMIVLGYSIAPHESIVSNTPVENIESFEGKVMRVPFGTMASRYFESLGAIIREVPYNKVREALTMGRLEVADYSTLSNNLSEGFYKVSKHTNYKGFHSMPLIEFTVNLYEWAKLPRTVQDVIRKHASNWHIESIKEMNRRNDKAAEKIESYGVTVYEWSDEDLKKARQAAVLVWDEYANKSPEAYKLVNNIKAWLKERGQL